MNNATRNPLSVIVVGGGIAGAEALLALRALAGDRVDLTLVAPGPDLVLRPLAVAEPFLLGHATHHPLADLAEATGADWIAEELAEVDAGAQEIVLGNGERLHYGALVIAVGARAVAGIEHATTWSPDGDQELLGGLLRDLEEGYARRVAFCIPAGAAWPLPAYELAMMTARQVDGMRIDRAEVTVITPEAIPLALFGAEAAVALREELDAAGVRVETASLARVERGDETTIVLQPTTRRITVDRVIAMPEVVGPAIPGLPSNDGGFLPVDAHGRVRDVERVWAAGDGIAYPVKFGGLATQQADAVAADVAALAGAANAPEPLRPRLHGVLMTGARPRPLGQDGGVATVVQTPMWKPAGKVSGTYLSPYLDEPGEPAPPDAVEVDEELPGLDEGTDGAFGPLWGRGQDDPAFIRRLGRLMHGYEAELLRSEQLLRDHRPTRA